MKDLKEKIHEYETKEYLSAGPLVAKDTVTARVLQKVMKVLGKGKDDLKIFFEGIYVHPQVSEYLSRRVPFDHPVFSPKEQTFLYRFYSRDFHPASDLNSFANMMDHKMRDPESRLCLKIAFGFDGFLGDKLVDYVGNLKYAMRESTDYADETDGADKTAVARVVHLRAVRHMYETFGDEGIEAAVRNAFEGKTDTESEVYAKFLGSLFLDVKSVVYHATDLPEN